MSKVFSNTNGTSSKIFLPRLDYVTRIEKRKLEVWMILEYFRSDASPLLVLEFFISSTIDARVNDDLLFEIRYVVINILCTGDSIPSHRQFKQTELFEAKVVLSNIIFMSRAESC